MFAGFAPAGKISPAILESRGLGKVLGDIQTLDDLCHSELTGKGPDGNPGLIISALPQNRETPRKIGYFPGDNQQWTKVGDSLWIGIDKIFPPTPADLARKTIYKGYKIRLGDGNEWEIPIIRRPDSGQSNLPRDMYWDEVGNFTLKLLAEYQEIWDKTARIARLFYDPEATDFGYIDLDEALTIALEALGLNYRVGRPEQMALRLINTANWEACLGAMVDVPFVQESLKRMEEAQKKSE